MRNGNRITLLILGLAIVGILAALMREAFSGPVFRAGDHATYGECVAAIPPQWLPGSMDHTGAETACRYENERRLREGR